MLTPEKEKEIREKVTCMWNHLTTGDKRKISKEDIFEICSELLGEVDRLRSENKLLQMRDVLADLYVKLTKDCDQLREKLAVVREALKWIDGPHQSENGEDYTDLEFQMTVKAREALSKIGDEK
jgi:hypothetical protein